MHFYRNEKEVGEGIQKSGIKREEVFVVTKIGPYAKKHGYEQAINGVKTSLERYYYNDGADLGGAHLVPVYPHC